VLFNEQSPCTWLSTDGQYQIAYTLTESGIAIFTAKHSEYQEPFLSLEAAQAWCRSMLEIERLTAPTPELDWPTNCELQR
jgi:hypothetical protein